MLNPVCVSRRTLRITPPLCRVRPLSVTSTNREYIVDTAFGPIIHLLPFCLSSPALPLRKLDRLARPSSEESVPGTTLVREEAVIRGRS
jgi:hypothetical protein